MAPSFPLSLPVAQAKALRRLHQKKYRMASHAFLLQGHKGVEALLQSDYVVHTLVATPTYWQAYPPPVREGLHCYTCPPAQLATVAPLQSCDDIVAMATMKPAPPLPTQGRILVLDTLRDPGNLGTIIRTAVWYGITAIVASPTTVAYYNPKVLQATMGAFVHMPICYTALVPFLEAAQLPTIGATLVGTPLEQAPLPAEALLVIGNESHGIRSALYPYLQGQVTLARSGRGDSLNAAVAASILMAQWVAVG